MLFNPQWSASEQFCHPKHVTLAVLLNSTTAAAAEVISPEDVVRGRAKSVHGFTAKLVSEDPRSNDCDEEENEVVDA